MFKVITMSDYFVREQFNFTFPSLVNSDKADNPNAIQRITLSRDLSKLMEVYDDSKCRIWTKKTLANRKKVTWQLTH